MQCDGRAAINNPRDTWWRNREPECDRGSNTCITWHIGRLFGVGADASRKTHAVASIRVLGIDSPQCRPVEAFNHWVGFPMGSSDGLGAFRAWRTTSLVVTSITSPRSRSGLASNIAWISRPACFIALRANALKYSS